MTKVREFLGEQYKLTSITKLGKKFVITADNLNDGENYAFLNDDGHAVFLSETDAKEWWDSNNTKYKGTEVCAW